MLGNKGLLALSGAVEVASGDSSIFQRLGREQVLRVTVLLNETLRDDPKDLSPNFANSVDTPVTGLIEGLVGRGVDGLVL